MISNQFDFISAFIHSFTSIDDKKGIKRIARLVTRNKRFLWQFPELDGKMFLEGEEADDAFDNVSKQGAYEYVFDGPFSYEKPIPLQKEHLSSLLIRIDGLREFYVFDVNFKWCYVITHEGDGCGPFFFKSSDF